jgi:hypothetical protein
MLLAMPKTRNVDLRQLADASFVRIWRTGIDPARAHEYDEFARTTSVSMFRRQPGFVAVLFTSRGSERTVITLWEDRESADALNASATYEATVNEIKAAGFLRGEQSVDAFALDGMFARS